MAESRLPDRCELKYLVPLDEGMRFLAAVKPYVARDRHADEEGSYHIRSVYFETTDWRFYAEKVDGVAMRRKFRLRRYLGTDVFFAEIKERVERLVRKHRVRITPEQARAVLAGDYGCFDEMSGGGGPNAEQAQEIATFLSSIDMRPMVLTNYRRYPRVGLHDPKLRVTLDIDVEGDVGHIGQALIDGDEEAWHTPVVPRSMAILELKVSDGLPTWLAEAIHDAGLELRAISKYCMAADLHPFCFPQPRELPESEVVLPGPPAAQESVAGLADSGDSIVIDSRRNSMTQRAREAAVVGASAALVLLILLLGVAFSPSGLPWTDRAYTHRLLGRVDAAVVKYHQQHEKYPAVGEASLLEANEKIVDAFSGNRATDGFNRQIGQFFMYFDERDLRDVDIDGRLELYDPWGAIIRYQSDGKGFKLWSAGRDGKDDTSDDILLGSR